MRPPRESHVAIGYIRVSTQEQVDIGESLRRQEEMIRQYCKLKGIERLQIIRDEGVSGYKSNRDGFQELRRICLKGEISTVIVADLSRLSRSVRATLEFIEDIICKNEIDFVSLSQDINTSTPTGKAFLAIASVFNELYRNEIAYKTKAALAHKRARGERVGRMASYGFDEDGDGRLVANDVQQQNIRLIADLRKAGLTLSEIVKELESRKIQTKTGAKWYPKTVRDILQRFSGT